MTEEPSHQNIMRINTPIIIPAIHLEKIIMACYLNECCSSHTAKQFKNNKYCASASALVRTPSPFPRMHFYLTPTFATKTLFGTAQIIYFIVGGGVLRQQQNNASAAQKSSLPSLFLLPFFNIKQRRLPSPFSKVLMLPYYFNKGGGGGSK